MGLDNCAVVGTLENSLRSMSISMRELGAFEVTSDSGSQLLTQMPSCGKSLPAAAAGASVGSTDGQAASPDVAVAPPCRVVLAVWEEPTRSHFSLTYL